jgi:hypothetical protein
MCNKSLAKSNGVSKHGFKKWHKYCTECSKVAYNPKLGYLRHKSDTCECCSFKSVDKCQLDIVYKDSNRKNKDISNIQTLCANCSRLRAKKIKQQKKSILDITVDADTTI